ncbi:MAG: ribose 5-phosphate isomerase A [Ktedonobacteraceae bacterium]
MMPHAIEQDTWKQMVGTAAAKLVEAGMIVGLGTGSTANFLIYALAQRVQAGLRIAGAISSSQASHDLAANLGIPVTDLDTHPTLDIYIDGADEIDTQLNLIKGAGGALLREKIVASAARRFVVIADVTKQVTHLGQHFPVPVETVPFASSPVRKHLEALGAIVTTRVIAGKPFITENGNIILDCAFSGGISDPIGLNANMHRIVGVVETGLFLGMAQQALIGGPDGVLTLPE